MEKLCNRCHAVLADKTAADWCPACGGAIVDLPDRNPLATSQPVAEVDHRGILLPRRSPLGGIITPQ